MAANMLVRRAHTSLLAHKVQHYKVPEVRKQAEMRELRVAGTSHIERHGQT